jgi:hypothetical protein
VTDVYRLLVVTATLATLVGPKPLSAQQCELPTIPVTISPADSTPATAEIGASLNTPLGATAHRDIPWSTPYQWPVGIPGAWSGGGGGAPSNVPGATFDYLYCLDDGVTCAYGGDNCLHCTGSIDCSVYAAYGCAARQLMRC